MEENKNTQTPENLRKENTEEVSFFNFNQLFQTFILNWQWFALSLIIALGITAIYLRYTTPRYQSSAKMLIKDEDNNTRSRGGLLNAANLGVISNTEGIDNEMEILSSYTLAADVVRDLKLYVTYQLKGRVKNILVYKNQPVTVDIDAAHLDNIKVPISMVITKNKSKYHVSAVYYTTDEEDNTKGPITKEWTLSSLGKTIKTPVGNLTFSSNGSATTKWKDDFPLFVSISSPMSACKKFKRYFSVNPTSKNTSIVKMSIVDEIPRRSLDYLSQLVVCYNRQANEDKNEVAYRTEEFINGRLEKINAELGETEGQLEAYKKSQHMTELRMNATAAMTGSSEYERQLANANTQIALLNSVSDFVDGDEYQTLPSNVGLNDATASQLINKYNEIVLQRNRLLRSASEDNPSVTPLTAQLDNLKVAIKNSMDQTRKNLEIQRNSIQQQFSKYSGQISATPEQERMLTQIGRQQEVRSGLYLMLLQKREENSISLASTADKGKLIEAPESNGQITPVPTVVIPIALVAGLLIPGVVLFLLKLFRYKIEGHDDVARLTQLPIIADVAVASETAKTKADIVVHENKNNQMEEIFRAMRTNVQFMLREGQKVIMFTSTTSGEGKTFNCANLAVSFALLGKKVILVGLDIRKPRLAELFEIDDHKHGITPLLAQEHPSEDDLKAQILPSGVNGNLDLLLAGPVPPNPSELISRQSLDIVIGYLKENYDYVLIDTAPVGLVTDTLQVGRVIDATIYMCRADYTPKSSFDLVNSLANEKKLPNMAIVINGIDMSKKKYGYYYGYGKYGKYSRYTSYGKYGNYGSSYGGYGGYGTYGSYGGYSNSHYGNKNDTSIKL
ncbi:MAG: polysaccharide biosynthesis tyrosine autokinase [Prevotella sp.]|nr:polysaccharide biosynthesis tyrosine autokinase [Prevotella sp.]